MLNDFIADMLSAESLNTAIKKEFPDTQQVGMSGKCVYKPLVTFGSLSIIQGFTFKLSSFIYKEKKRKRKGWHYQSRQHLKCSINDLTILDI